MTEEQIKRILQAGHSVLCNAWNCCTPLVTGTNIVTGFTESDRYKTENGMLWDHAEIHPSVANRYFEHEDGIIYKWLTVFEAEEAEKFIGKKCLLVNTILLEPSFCELLKIDINRTTANLFVTVFGTRYLYVAVPLTEPAETPKQKQLRELKEKAEELDEQIQRLEAE